MAGIPLEIVIKLLIQNVHLKRNLFDYHTKMYFYNYNINYTTIHN